MKYKIDFTFTMVLMLFGILYTVLTFSWYILPGKLNLEAMYFPAVAFMYIFAGLFNYLRLKVKHQLIVKISIIVNLLLLIYAVYLTYLVKVAIPPYIATSVLAIVFAFSLTDLSQNQPLEVEG
ncbi:MAG: hypothetical protein ACRBBR_16710 [Cellvibrionaceae bacterium]